MSKQIGNKINYIANINGRVQIDMLSVMQRDFKLRSYKLDDVANDFLGERKEDVHFYQIRNLYFESNITRGKLALYCLKDALLPLKLMIKLMVLVKNVEMARVTGISLNEVLTRGQQVRIMSQLLRKCKTRNMVIPKNIRTSNDEYESYIGAHVIKPEIGFYNEPISTLDFVSLYPSIMITHNLCYSTLLTEEKIMKYNLKEEIDYERSPSNDCFVKKAKYSGLLPEILESLVDRRKYVKNLLKNEQDKVKKQILDSRQLALKITANSVYGFTGAQNGMLPCLSISRSVTTYGQKMLRKTKYEIETKYKQCKVIYGDTDSVMIKFETFSEFKDKYQLLSEVMRISKEQAEYVSSKFRKPIQLDFEKVYYPYLLINKKRYAGLLYTKPEKPDKLDCKGLEIVRRDNCKLVPELLKEVLDLIFMKQNVQGAIEYAKNIFDQLKNYTLPIEKLIISKQLSKLNYKAKQPHIELANKIEKRNPGSGPKLGDRVPYVIINTGKCDKNERLYEKAEDPEYVIKNKLKPDISYYINKQISVPLIRILENIIGKETAEKLFSYNVQNQKMKKKRKISEDKYQLKIDQFFKKMKN
ncbi:uncharacterized protein B4U79_12154 [Dinothrombium tinctorium]|nr:uncharacterized protein B4U79_01829 [Dinothrombium tinctorium]RWS01316.1 uncharacterized protein B4U79_12154 [Dinothrombium tinctorium]